MKNQHKKKVPEDFMRKEYDFDYRTGVRGKYARKATEKNGYVKLTDEVHKYFKTSEDVNNVLRAVIEAFPKARQRAV